MRTHVLFAGNELAELIAVKSHSEDTGPVS